MLFSYPWLQSFFKSKLPQPKKMAELLTMHSFETERSVSSEDHQTVFDIEVLPNRASDCLCHLGIARECATLTNKTHNIPGTNVKENSAKKAKDLLEIEIKDNYYIPQNQEAPFKNKVPTCPRYTARVITDVKIQSSPSWMQKRLKACGLQPINNIVDITNYVMLETGQPLHAFDFDKLTPSSSGKAPKKMKVRFAKPKEKITTIDGETRTLDENVFVIADSQEPIAIAGIKGGKSTGIDKNTKTIVLESANFDPYTTRISSKKVGISSDASYRFENGIDPNLTSFAINRAASLIEELTEAKTAKGTIDHYYKKIYPKKVKIKLDYVKSLLGIGISKSKVNTILKKLGFEIIPSDRHSLSIKVPTFRRDINIPEDIIEEIGRIYGYDNITPKMPVVPLSAPGKNKSLLWERRIKEMMKNLGFTETYLYSFISEKEKQLAEENVEANLNQNGDYNPHLIKVKNATSSNFKYLRPSLLHNLLKVIKKNRHKKEAPKIFEIGKTYGRQDNNEIEERKTFSGIITGKEKFYDMKGVVEALFEKLGISELFFDSFKAVPQLTPEIFWQGGRTAEIRLKEGNQRIGFLGEISQEVLDFYKIEKPITAFEMDFEKILSLVKEEEEYKAPSPYPKMIRDVSILVPTSVLAGEVTQTIQQAGGVLVKDIEIFDVYQGPPLPQGKKNFAFHIIYQAEDRTLTSEEIDKIQERIINTLESQTSWEVRK